jgi:hypothetical protein
LYSTWRQCLSSIFSRSKWMLRGAL